jgi:hypothetical protein
MKKTCAPLILVCIIYSDDVIPLNFLWESCDDELVLAVAIILGRGRKGHDSHSNYISTLLALIIVLVLVETSHNLKSEFSQCVWGGDSPVGSG